jgi:hypothetical protein
MNKFNLIYRIIQLFILFGILYQCQIDRKYKKITHNEIYSVDIPSDFVRQSSADSSVLYYVNENDNRSITINYFAHDSGRIRTFNFNFKTGNDLTELENSFITAAKYELQLIGIDDLKQIKSSASNNNNIKKVEIEGICTHQQLEKYVKYYVICTEKLCYNILFIIPKDDYAFRKKIKAVVNSFHEK